MRTYTVHSGIHAGRAHLLNQTNRQDALSFFDGSINGVRTIAGIICDGCSEGNSSEVGATLASSYLIREITRLCQEGIPVALVPTLLYSRLLHFLNLILLGYTFSEEWDRINFIKHHLLFTVVGFIVSEEESIVFLAGDGTVVLNDDIYHVDSGNMPKYPSYHLVDRSALLHNASGLPTSFDVWKLDTILLKRLAIGSDAWQAEETLLDNIWGISHPAGLQRRLNQWSHERHFVDDVSVITLEVDEVGE